LAAPPPLGLGLKQRVSKGAWYDALLSIPDCVLLIDASTSSSVTLSGSHVSALADLSGQGNNFTQATGAMQPPYNLTGINGLPSVDTRAAVSQKIMDCVNPGTSILTGSGATSVIVFDPVAAASQAGIGAFSEHWGNTGVAQDLFPYTDGNFYDTWFTTVRKAISGIVLGSAFAYATTSETGNFTAYQNNVQVFTTSSNSTGSDGSNPSMFGDSLAQDDWWMGLFSLRAAWNRVLTSIELGQVQAALSSRFGV
jgi:hypothetical protein